MTTRTPEIMSSKYNKIYFNHQHYLRRKELYKLKQGHCVYLIDMKIAFEDDKSITKIKVCHSSDITNRVSGFRTSNPFCKVLMVLYTYHSDFLQKLMKIRYENFLKPNNSGFITGVEIDELKETMVNFANSLNCEIHVKKVNTS